MPTQYLSTAIAAADLLAFTICLGVLLCWVWLISEMGVIHERVAHSLLARLWRTLEVCVAVVNVYQHMLWSVLTAIMRSISVTNSLLIRRE